MTAGAESKHGYEKIGQAGRSRSINTSSARDNTWQGNLLQAEPRAPINVKWEIKSTPLDGSSSPFAHKLHHATIGVQAAIQTVAIPRVRYSDANNTQIPNWLDPDLWVMTDRFDSWLKFSVTVYILNYFKSTKSVALLPDTPQLHINLWVDLIRFALLSLNHSRIRKTKVRICVV